MRKALNVIGLSLRDLWQDLFTTSLCNLMWLVLNVLILPGPPATMALFYVGNRIARGEPTDAGDFLYALRRYFGLGWRWGALNLVVFFILIGDVILTGRLSQSSGAYFAQGLYLAALAAWLLLQLYALPFLFEQETPGLRLALRNGAVMLGRNLGFSIALGVLLALLLAAGSALFLLSLAGGGIFLAVAGSHAVRNRLAAVGGPGE